MSSGSKLVHTSVSSSIAERECVIGVDQKRSDWSYLVLYIPLEDWRIYYGGDVTWYRIGDTVTPRIFDRSDFPVRVHEVIHEMSDFCIQPFSESSGGFRLKRSDVPGYVSKLELSLKPEATVDDIIGIFAEAYGREYAFWRTVQFDQK